MKIDLNEPLIAPDKTVLGRLGEALYAVLVMPDMGAPYEEKERRIKLATLITTGQSSALEIDDWGYVTERAKLHPKPEVAVAAVTILRSAAKDKTVKTSKGTKVAE